jgi:ATP-binding protein involved in chromosome partitioning
MSEATAKLVLEKLKSVRGPDLESNIVDLGMVSDVFVSDGKAYFSITVPADRAKELEPLRLAAERVAKDVPGVNAAMVALTADRKASAGPAAAAPAKPAVRPQAGHDHAGHSHAAPGAKSPAKAGIPGIGAIIAVASGKGGVGKSTTAVNLALALKANGRKVGVLDADVYGPSMPRLLHISGKPQTVDGRMIKPMENYGLKVMSMGFLVEEETAMIWRGPMIQSALMQMMREVAWGELDVLVVDMPPGTGDAQLTMAQQVPLAGAVIAMFRKVEVPVLGIIENMSHFVCPVCGTTHDIFGHGGARAEATRIGVPFLGEVPLTMQIRETSDAGTPVVVSDPEGVHALAYRHIARNVWEQVSARANRPAPAIVFD